LDNTLSNPAHITELSPIAIHTALACAAASGWQVSLIGPAGWRAPGILAHLDDAGRLPFLNPWGLMSALPLGTPVRVVLQGDTGRVSFYTTTRGTDGQARWLLDTPTVIQIVEAREEPRLDVDPGALYLQHPEHGALTVVDLCARGISFQAPALLARKLEVDAELDAVLHMPEECTIPLRLRIRDVRMFPGLPLDRIVGTRLIGDCTELVEWYLSQACKVGVYAA
jgi:hypothetical protein